MARIQRVCSRCGSVTSFDFGQRVLGDELLWSGREECGHCGMVAEYDSIGDIPDDLRAHLLEQEQEWRLVFPRPEKRVEALRVLRESLDVPLAASKRMLDDLRGTKAKMVWLKQKFDDVGVTSILEVVPRRPKLPNTTSPHRPTG